MQDLSRTGVRLLQTYQITKEVHAKAVGLDALVSHHVVHQHQLAVLEPDISAVSLL